MIYLDYASTTPLDQEVLATYTKVLNTYFANADSLHTLGREANKLVEQSRSQIANLLKVNSDEVIFTSCASEANNYATKAFALANMNRGKHIISTCIEHSSVASSLQQLSDEFGFEVTYLQVDENGCVSIDDLKQALRKDTILVSMMLVNNEVGSIQPVNECADYVHQNSRAVFHVDCVQALGKIDIDLHNIDLASFSAHKIYGLKGSGFLIKKRNIKLLSLISAGQQEQGYRGGTTNSPSCIVLAKTLRLALERQKEAFNHVSKLNQYLRDEISQMDDFVINSPIDGSPFILNIADLKIGSEVMLNALDAKGICVSAISTCASHSKAVSHVLLSMNKSELIATHSIRISLSHQTTMDEVKQFISTLKEVHDDFKTR